jgi:hypothetical protein
MYRCEVFCVAFIDSDAGFLLLFKVINLMSINMSSSTELILVMEG